MQGTLQKKEYPFDMVIVSPNSAIDSYYILSNYRPNGVNRAREVFHTAGGKGINMARAAVNLGARPLCLGVLGGHSGRFVAAEMDREGIGHDMVWDAIETRRVCTTWVEGDPDSTVIQDPGEAISGEAQSSLAERVVQRSDAAPYTVMIGSLPLGASPDYYARLVAQLKAAGMLACVDCTGAVLQLAAAAGPHIIKVNREEFCLAFNRDRAALTWQEIGEVYEKLRPNGVDCLIVTDGPRGASIFSSQARPFHVSTPVDACVSTAGAGDTFYAALLLALARGAELHEAARYASTASAVSIHRLGCGFFDPGLVEIYLPRTVITPLV